LVPIAAAPPHSVIFVERARHLRRHPGQIAFPGGASDASDAGDSVRTALRELEEEIGVAPERVRVAGRLPDSKQELNRFIVTPIVGVLDEAARFRVDGVEIASLFAVPLAAILTAGAVYEDSATAAARGKPMYAFDYEGRHIWGFTGRILKSFLDAWNEPESSLRRRLSFALLR
jgi:8-oxo-dGTP pyrophosphatase MutT (NUDIX family)